jgi:hypothetical protein
MNPAEIGRAYVDALNRRDAQAILGLLTPAAKASSPVAVRTDADSFHRDLFGSVVRLKVGLKGLTVGTMKRGGSLAIAWCELRWTMRGYGTVRCAGTLVLKLRGSRISAVEMVYDSPVVQDMFQEEFLEQRSRPREPDGPAEESFTLIEGALPKIQASPALVDQGHIADHIAEYEELLDRKAPEADVQKFLEKHLYFWGHEIRLGTADTPLFSQVSLGDKFVCDFVFYDMGSDGMEWNLVEIEGPHFNLFNKNGEFSQRLNHAITQVRDWQQWINENHAYAEKLMPGVMLPLGVIFMGRRSELEDARRREALHYYNSQHRSIVTIHTLDRFLDSAYSALRGEEIATPRAARSGVWLRDRLPSQIRSWAHGSFGSQAEFLRSRMVGSNLSSD